MHQVTLKLSNQELKALRLAAAAEFRPWKAHACLLLRKSLEDRGFLEPIRPPFTPDPEPDPDLEPDASEGVPIG